MTRKSSVWIKRRHLGFFFFFFLNLSIREGDESEMPVMDGGDAAAAAAAAAAAEAGAAAVGGNGGNGGPGREDSGWGSSSNLTRRTGDPLLTHPS